MKLFSQILTMVALAASYAAEAKDGVTLTQPRGGPHGDIYSDEDIISAGQTVRAITIRTGERVNGVGLDITSPAGASSTLYHGGGGGDGNTLTLSEGEYVKCMETHWGEYHSHTRIRYIEFTTSRNNTLAGGTKATKTATDCADEGYQLGGFYGYCGKELDQVGAFWTKL